MLQDSFNTAQQDMAARALVEARVDADRMIAATRTALAADGDLLAPSERVSRLMVSRELAAMRRLRKTAADVRSRHRPPWPKAPSPLLRSA